MKALHIDELDIPGFTYLPYFVGWLTLKARAVEPGVQYPILGVSAITPDGVNYEPRVIWPVDSQAAVYSGSSFVIPTGEGPVISASNGLCIGTVCTSSSWDHADFSFTTGRHAVALANLSTQDIVVTFEMVNENGERLTQKATVTLPAGELFSRHFDEISELPQGIQNGRLLIQARDGSGSPARMSGFWAGTYNGGASYLASALMIR